MWRMFPRRSERLSFLLLFRIIVTSSGLSFLIYVAVDALIANMCINIHLSDVMSQVVADLSNRGFC